MAEALTVDSAEQLSGEQVAGGEAGAGTSEDPPPPSYPEAVPTVEELLADREEEVEETEGKPAEPKPKGKMVELTQEEHEKLIRESERARQSAKHHQKQETKFAQKLDQIKLQIAKREKELKADPKAIDRAPLEKKLRLLADEGNEGRWIEFIEAAVPIIEPMVLTTFRAERLKDLEIYRALAGEIGEMREQFDRVVEINSPVTARKHIRTLIEENFASEALPLETLKALGDDVIDDVHDAATKIYTQIVDSMPKGEDGNPSSRDDQIAGERAIMKAATQHFLNGAKPPSKPKPQRKAAPHRSGGGPSAILPTARGGKPALPSSGSFSVHD